MGTMIDNKICDPIARSIADSWHGGQWSALYSFASSGTIQLERLIEEIEGDLSWALAHPDAEFPNSPDDPQQLHDLLQYVKDHGERGAQEHWSDWHTLFDTLQVRFSGGTVDVPTLTGFTRQYFDVIVRVSGQDYVLSDYSCAHSDYEEMVNDIEGFISHDDGTLWRVLEE